VRGLGRGAHVVADLPGRLAAFDLRLEPRPDTVHAVAHGRADRLILEAGLVGRHTEQAVARGLFPGVGPQSRYEARAQALKRILAALQVASDAAVDDAAHVALHAALDEGVLGRVATEKRGSRGRWWMATPGSTAGRLKPLRADLHDSATKAIDDAKVASARHAARHLAVADGHDGLGRPSRSGADQHLVGPTDAYTGQPRQVQILRS
jgi:hypothetical protein